MEVLSRTHKYLECLQEGTCISPFHTLIPPTKRGMQLAQSYQGSLPPRYTKLIKESQRFYIGDLCNLPELKQHIDTDIFRLPFQRTVFEFNWDAQLPLLNALRQGEEKFGIASMFHVKSMLLLCEEDFSEWETNDHIIEKVHQRMRVAPLLLGTIDSAKLASFWVNDTSNTDALRGRDVVLDYFLHSILGVSESNRIIISPDEEPTVREDPRGQVHYQAVGPLRELVAGAISAVTVLLSCHNIETETIQPPRKLNLKRAENNKPPLLQFKVLKINSKGGKEAEAQSPEEPKYLSEGTPEQMQKRKSPAEHWRRGHFRHLSNKRIWIHGFKVGLAKNGRVEKDYQMIF